mmetsp:Transcript_15685/g.42547  ORF Transcript_15685/g.42547 Transcript_15685/m.42547 type:complete len:226 (-) Transcript_15685:2208-2885(-)
MVNRWNCAHKNQTNEFITLYNPSRLMLSSPYSLASFKSYAPSFSTSTNKPSSPKVPLTLLRPFRKGNSMTQPAPTTSAFTFFMRLTPAFRVPPVAMRSSISTTRCPGSTAPSCISILSELYSVTYSSEILGPGSFPGLRRGTKGTPSARARGAPNINPRASKPAMTSTFWSLYCCTKRSMVYWKAVGFSRMVVTSQNRMPFFGKSGTPRIEALMASLFSASETIL